MSYRRSNLFHRFASSIRYSTAGRRIRRWSTRRRAWSQGSMSRVENDSELGDYLPAPSNSGRSSSRIGGSLVSSIICLLVIVGACLFVYNDGSLSSIRFKPFISQSRASLEKALKLSLDEESSKVFLNSGMPRYHLNEHSVTVDTMLSRTGEFVRRIIPRIFGVESGEPASILANQISGLEKSTPPMKEISREHVTLAAMADVSKAEPPQEKVADPPVKAVVKQNEPPIDTKPDKQREPYKTPVVAIYHTHTSETYSDEKVNYIWQSKSPNSTDSDYVWGTAKGVVTVGTELSTALSKRGIKVIHSKRVHDYPSFRDAYKNALVSIDEILKANPDTDMVIDLHRDGLPEGISTVTIDGKKVARVFIAVTSDKFGLPHPNWRQNYAFALKLNAEIEKEYPGLSRGVVLRDDARWNQHVNPHAVIMEVGSNRNSINEALAAADLLVNPIVKVLESE